LIRNFYFLAFWHYSTLFIISSKSAISF